MENKNLYLVYVERINDVPNSKGFYEYEFFFSETPDIVWAEDWREQCPSSCNREAMRPDTSMYVKIKRLFSIYSIMAIQENSCFSLQDMIDGIVACAWEDISEYEEYPEPIRFVFQFGETLESVEDKLARRSQFFTEEKKEEQIWTNN